MALLSVRSIKNVALLTEDGAFALFFLPHPGGFASSRVPTPGNLQSKAKKMLIPGGQPGGGGLGAGGIDWCITLISKYKALYGKKTYRFRNLRKWKDFNKRQLTLHKMCVTSVLCGPWDDLWPSYGLYSKRFSLYWLGTPGKRPDGSIRDPSTENGRKFAPMAPVASKFRLGNRR